MGNRLSLGLNVLLAAVLVWAFLGQSPATGSTAPQLVNLPAPTFVPLPMSTHNDGVADVCGAQQALTPGDEHFGDLNAAKGSFEQFVRLPKGATATSVSLYANDFDSDFDVHAFLVRKLITDGTTPKE